MNASYLGDLLYLCGQIISKSKDHILKMKVLLTDESL